MSRGLIFNVQRFSLHDGPGIRTTVFFKGCPLRCFWCHNPESHRGSPEIAVDPRRCISCGRCREACPNGLAGEPGREGSDACTLCGGCVEACPSEARRMIGRWVTTEDLLPELLRDRVFFEESGGGVTFSGGEPLAQHRFLAACLAACLEAGLRTAVDTCGHASRSAFSRVAALTDLFLFDMKTMDSRLHRRYTGAGNEVILERLRFLSGLGARIWLRVPVIPGFNDDDRNLESIRRLATSLPERPRVSLLPFHRQGLGKKGGPERMGRAVDPIPPSRENLEALAETFRAAGLETSIGG